jgi:two-component system, OmpR family, response regulator VicR
MTRIAVVNDDTVFLEMMAAVLQEQRYEVRIYREAHHAFEQLRADLPEVIILDIRMETPESGWNLLELLTLDRATNRVPMVVCSAAIHDLRSHQEWLNDHGIQVLPKPFDIEELYACVERALGK